MRIGIALATMAACLLPAAGPERPRTFANPIYIDYRFMLDAPSRREAADPMILIFSGRILPVRLQVRRLLALHRHDRLEVRQAGWPAH
jgi:hypothetical protein